MDIQKMINDSISKARAESLAKSDRLTLGEMIAKLEVLVDKYKDKENQPVVMYDFEYLFPTFIDSWRGVYAELALNHTTYGNGDFPMTVENFLQMLKDADGERFYGYKGGEYVMSRQTPVWVANYGNSGSTAVVDILDEDYQIIIVTGYRKN